MRVIAGFYRSRVLAAPSGLATRPTSDRLRETLFNVLAGRMEGARFLDLYAGSGAVGIEALSRGAAEVTFVERSPAALAVLRANLDRLGVRNAVRAEIRVQAASVGVFLGRRSRSESAGESESMLQSQSRRFDLVFLDPPYEATEEYARTLGWLGGAASGLLTAGAVVIAEHRRKERPEERIDERYGVLLRTRVLEQGDAALSFYSVEQSSGLR